MRTRRTWLAVTVAVLCWPAATAQAAAQLPAASCGSLTALDLADVDTQVVSAADSTQNGHAFCDVKGYISPQTQFEALLPETTWQGDYLQEGCGGFCGTTGVSLSDPSRTSGHQGPFAPLANGELAVAADDQGHEGPGALWAKHDFLLRVVFGYRSEHSLAQATKAIMQAYYGHGPAHSYFDGVSDGGHEALDLAQRYPGDFDGIIAGAPANNWAPLVGEYLPWQIRSNIDARGNQILDASKLPALHAAVMKACANANGVIPDPRSCTFDPGTLRCPTGTDAAGCLTPPQVAMVRSEYRGPTDPRGRGLFDGGEPYGSEISWQGWLVDAPGDPAFPRDTAAWSIADGYLRFAAFLPNPPSSFRLSDWTFNDAGYAALERLGGIYNATDPDLSAFRARGGKLIIYHGWADQAISPWATLDYYVAVERQAGGYAHSQSFSRLYMIPGLYHCPCGPYATGDPATNPQFMAQLVAWVEQGQAPGNVSLPVTSQTTGTPAPIAVAPFDALGPVPHNAGLNSNYEYIGARSAYQPHNELWCHEQGTGLACSGHRSGDD